MNDIYSLPLIQYYFALNLVKAYILYKNPSTYIAFKSNKKSYHGLSEDNLNSLFNDWNINTKESKRNGNTNNFSENIFHELFKTLHTSDENISSGYPSKIEIKKLLPEIIFAHRLWHKASSSNNDIFLRITPNFLQISEDGGRIFFYVKNNDLQNTNLAHENYNESYAKISKLLGNILGKSEYTTPQEHSPEGVRVYCDYYNPKRTSGRLSSCFEEYKSICKVLRRRLWVIVSSTPPYRKYYLNLKFDDQNSLHQLISMFAFSFFLSSITRYRPFQFQEMLKKEKLESFSSEFISYFPNQFLYLIASEIEECDINRSALL